MLTNPIDYLSQVHDPRRQNKNLLHPLKNILTIALTAVICGYHDWVDIEDFGNVFKRLNKDELSRYFSEWMNQTQANHPHIAIDGKFIQGGYKNDNALQHYSLLPPLPVKPNSFLLKLTLLIKTTKLAHYPNC